MTIHRRDGVQADEVRLWRDGDHMGRRGRSVLVSILTSPLRAIVTALATGRSEPGYPRLPYEPPWPSGLPLIGDFLLALVLFVGSVANLRTVSMHGDAGQMMPELVVSWLVISAAVVARNRWPLAAWRVAAAAVLLTGGAVWGGLPVIHVTLYGIAAYLLCCYTVATRNPWNITVAVWGITLVIVGFLVGLSERTPEMDVIINAPPWRHDPQTIGVLVVLSTAVVLLFGANRRVGRRAQLDLFASAERNARERTARALVEERSRIARELHDVVAHHMSVIAIQAEAAPLRHGDDTKALASDLSEIRGTALDALAETRRILAVLRQDWEGGDTQPQPDLGRIDELISKAKTAGHDVTLSTTGTLPSVQPGVALSAYRIVQESLSNVMRHAPGANVEVDLAFEPTQIRIRVTNGPVGTSHQPRLGSMAGVAQCHGLVGMRERAAMLGGTLKAGPTANGGFEVVAILPLEAR